MYSEQSNLDYQRIEKAIEFIRENQADQPTLDEVASHIHLSRHHFQRLFTRWAGVSPKKFLQYLTIQYARERLDRNLSLAEVSQEAGLSGPGRLHDLFMGIEGMTPEQYRDRDRGLPYILDMLTVRLENTSWPLLVRKESVPFSLLKMKNRPWPR